MRGGSNPRRPDCESRRANHETTFKDHSQAAKARKFARRRSKTASTHTISAAGSPRSRQIRTAPQSASTHLRRGFAAVKTNSHGATARALRHARSSWRVRRGLLGATARALRHARSPQRVCRGQDKFTRRHSESASTRTISAEGSRRPRHIRTSPQ